MKTRSHQPVSSLERRPTPPRSSRGWVGPGGQQPVEQRDLADWEGYAWGLLAQPDQEQHPAARIILRLLAELDRLQRGRTP